METRRQRSGRTRASAIVIDGGEDEDYTSKEAQVAQAPPRKRARHAAEAPRLPWAKGFSPPDAQAIDRALGVFPLRRPPPCSPDALTQIQDHVLYRRLASLDPPLPAPIYDLDWLHVDGEEGQTMSEYLQLTTMRSGRWRPLAAGTSRTICLLPIQAETEASDMSLQQLMPSLVQFTRAYYHGMNVCTLPPLLLRPRTGNQVQTCSTYGTAWRIRVRTAGSRRQLRIDTVLDALRGVADSAELDSHVSDLFCIVAVTMEDLYDTPTDLFVAGMADGNRRVAVFSFLRYDPRIDMSETHWWELRKLPRIPAPLAAMFQQRLGRRADRRDILLRRCCKTLCHEIAHLVGVDHCIYHDCVMCGSGNISEDDRQPMFLCAIDMRKLQLRLGSRLEARYAALHHVYQQNQWHVDAAHAQARCNAVVDLQT